ncbi:MAG: hypothetical protein MZV63_67040 [Marinilabiliales bacterium]|nr:hypothetical protein [Marinilabiliales bacterium]
MIKPLYESTVTLYPSSNITEARTLLGEVTSKTALFGGDDATEKLIQVINSEQVREYLKGEVGSGRTLQDQSREKGIPTLS